MKIKHIIWIITIVVIVVALGLLAYNGKTSTNPGVWIGAILTLAIYSFLYEDNLFYKFAEHLLVGISNGFGFSVIFHEYVRPKLWKPLVVDKTWIDPLMKAFPDMGGLWAVVSTKHFALLGNSAFLWTLLKLLSLVIPACLGFMMFGRFTQNYRWTSRFPISFYMGMFSGMAVLPSFQTYIFEQMQGTIQQDFIKSGFWGSLGTFIIVFGTLTTLVYFFFSIKHEGVIGKTARVGIYFIMTGFGAAFGYTVMARISLLIGRMQFLMHDWIKIIK